MIKNENILSLLLSKIVKIEDKEYFFLPDLKIVVELKGNNQYYRQDLKNGKLAAKNKAAEKFCKANGLRYRFVLDEYIDDFILTLLSK